jgi:hypothetical protein
MIGAPSPPPQVAHNTHPAPNPANLNSQADVLFPMTFTLPSLLIINRSPLTLTRTNPVAATLKSRPSRTCVISWMACWSL